MGVEYKAPEFVMQDCGITTQREWRKLKRGEFRKLRDAFESFRLGSAYVPTGNDGDIGEMRRILSRIETSMSQKNWGK